MKVGILTLYYKNHNYGGQLQAYALCTYLNQLNGVDCEQITYDYKGKKRRTAKDILFLLYSYLFHPKIMLGLHSRIKMFQAFEKAIPHSQVISSPMELRRAAEKYDYVFTGSDQVWNQEYAGGAFFLSDIQPDKRCAYAASFGKDNVIDNSLTNNTIETLKNYRFLSVREKSAKKILEYYNIKEAKIVCDPTLLLDSNEWEHQISHISPITQDKYAFVYLLGNGKVLRDDLKRKIRDESLKIVSIPHIHFSYQKRDRDFADIEIYKAGPLEFLRLIKDATVVVTDSFHCTLFSILFQKNFWTLSRSVKRNAANTNGRMYTLLDKAGLMDRYAGNAENIDLKAAQPSVDSKRQLVEYAENSRKLLLDFLGL